MKLFRTLIFWLHLAVGCVAGLIILAMSITGVMLAFERQINAWADAPAVLTAKPEAPSAALDSVLSSLKSGGQGVPSQLVLHNASNTSIEVRFGRERTLFLDPSTAAVIGAPSETSRAFFGSVERVHRSLGLGMQSAFGRGITGAANLAFLFMLLSGIYLWIPKLMSWAALKIRVLFRRRLNGKAREWNWHHVIGIWSAIPLLFIVVTGVIMSYPWASNLLYTITGTQPPAGGWRGEGPRRDGHGPGRAPVPAPVQVQFRSLDSLAIIAKQQAPGWNSMTIDVPEEQDRAVGISMDKSIGGQPEQAMQLVIDRQSGDIETIHRFSDNNAGRKLRAWARFLHTGEEFGVAGETVTTFACIGAVLLVWTGLSMAIRRASAAMKTSTEGIGAVLRPARELEPAPDTIS